MRKIKDFYNRNSLIIVPIEILILVILIFVDLPHFWNVTIPLILLPIVTLTTFWNVQSFIEDYNKK